jgi:hypothetical protein
MTEPTTSPTIPGLLTQIPIELPDVAAGPFRVRVVAFGTARAGDILDHEGNPFVPTEFQKEGIQGSLEQNGVVDVLKCYLSARNGGRLTLMDGHKRKGMHLDQVWPVVVLDLTDEEADSQLIVHNLLSAWSGMDPMKMDALLQSAKAKNSQMAATQERIRSMIADQVAIAQRVADGGGQGAAAAREKQFAFDDMIKVSVKVVIPVGPELATIERAIKATGQQRRGAALLDLAEFYLENSHE